ncbi:MAG: hypothetical protein JJU45_10035 [Acidimicrobiia bacterium]|nr:hypothetical protein [Acidimicrobiia bacterium]
MVGDHDGDMGEATTLVDARPRSQTPAAESGRDRLLSALWRHRNLVLAGFVFVLGAAVAVRIRPIILYDDAAITARYVERMVAGQGWTYNPGDRTNGASAPLFTLVLAAVHALGIEVIAAIRLVVTFSYAATVALVAYLGARVAGLAAGALAALFLLAWVDFSTQGLSGMESPFAAALGLAAIVALSHGSPTWAGVFLGLAVVNKLDAGALALAVALAVLLVQRRFPWRTAWVSAVVAAPWFLFSQLYFGSALPHSFTQKATGEVVDPGGRDVGWILDSLENQSVELLVLLGLAAAAFVPSVARRSPTAAVALLVVVVWPVLHAVTFSLLDLGAAHPWYLTVLYPPLALAAGCTLVLSVQAVARCGRWPAIGAFVVAVLVAVPAIGLLQDEGGGSGEMVRRLRQGATSYYFLHFEVERRGAGLAVAELAEPGDVVATCFGWVAFEARQQYISEICPLNTRVDVGPPDWYVTGGFPGHERPSPPAGTTVYSVDIDNEVGGWMDVIELDR